MLEPTHEIKPVLSHDCECFTTGILSTTFPFLPLRYCVYSMWTISRTFYCSQQDSLRDELLKTKPITIVTYPKLLVLHNKYWIVQKLYGSVLFLNFHPFTWRRLLSSSIMSQKQGNNKSISERWWSKTSNHVAKSLAPTKAASKLWYKKVHGSHHVLRLPAICGDTGIVYHYSNWWCNPKGQLFIYFWKERERAIMRWEINWSV